MVALKTRLQGFIAMGQGRARLGRSLKNKSHKYSLPWANGQEPLWFSIFHCRWGGGGVSNRGRIENTIIFSMGSASLGPTLTKGAAQNILDFFFNKINFFPPSYPSNFFSFERRNMDTILFGLINWLKKIFPPPPIDFFLGQPLDAAMACLDLLWVSDEYLWTCYSSHTMTCQSDAFHLGIILHVSVKS